MARLLIAQVLVSLAAVPAMAEVGPFEDGDRYLSAAQLAAHGAITVKLDERRAFKVIALESGESDKRCKLDVPSLRTLVAARISADKWDSRLPLGAKLTFELKADKDSRGELICFGDGTGCKVTIETAPRLRGGAPTPEDVPAARINERGYELDVARVGRVRMSRVTAPPKAAKGCRVHLPSVVEAVQAARPVPGVKVTVGLKLVYYGTDDWGCKGGGSDCHVEVEIP